MSREVLEITPGFTFVEVGCNDSPVTTRGKFPFPPEHQYIGIDTDTQSLERAREQTARANPQVNAQFIEADARDLPLPNECADEFFVSNVFGDPSVEILRVYGIVSERRREIMANAHPDAIPPGVSELVRPNDFQVIPAILKEAKRILKPDGKLTILETLTPPPDDILKVLLENAGISVEEQVGYGEDGWEPAVTPYYEFAAKDRPNAYEIPPVIYFAAV